MTWIALAGLAITGPACASEPTRGAAARVAPPSSLDCPRDSLTSYNGQVAQYRRTDTAVAVAIETDWGTVEPVGVRLETPDDVTPFLLEGAAFGIDDWAQVESSPGIARDGLRAIAWVCEDGETPPVIDWRPLAQSE